MGNEPRITGSYRKSVARFTSKADPRLRGSVTALEASPMTGILAETEIPYAPIVPAADSVDGTIPVASLTSPLLVTAAKWDQVEEEDYVFLFVDGRAAGDPEGLPIAEQPDPIEMFITVAELDLLAEGPHTIRFEMGSGFGDNYVSQDATIRIDRTPPGGDKLPRIRFLAEYEQNGVTINQIVADGDELKGSIATYGDQKIGDTITTFIMNKGGGTPTPGPVLTVASEIEAHVATFTLAQLQQAAADDVVEFWYVVADKAGNTKTSDRSELRMLVAGAPDQLLAPRIELFSDDNLVNEGDARTPITVDIPQYGHAEVGDEIVLNLKGPAGIFYPISVQPPLAAGDLPVDPEAPDADTIIRSIQVPYGVVSMLGTTPIFTFDCSYTVVRSRFEFPSPVLPVDVDITLAGGPDPDPETPQHEDYAPPVVTHSGVGAEDNHIPVGYIAPVFATISHLTTATTPAELFENGDTVQLFRYDTDGKTPVAVGVEAPATPGDDLVIELDPADVVSGVWEFFYEVARELPGGQVNRGVSPTQVVTIDDADELPGGPNLLPVAIFRNAETKQGFPAIGYTRSQTHGGTIVRIYEYINMALGDSISIHWQGNDALRGTGNDIPAALYEPAAHVVDAADLVPRDDRLKDDPLPDPGVINKVFVDFLVPYAEMQKITPPSGTTKAYGSAWLTYSVTSAKGSNVSESDRSKFKPLVIDARAPN